MAAFALKKARGVNNISKVFSQANKMPTLIATNGLAPTLTFMASKNEYKETLNAFMEWMSEESVFSLKKPSDANDFIDKILRLDSAMYRTITNEAIEFYGWFRRFITAIKG